MEEKQDWVKKLAAKQAEGARGREKKPPKADPPSPFYAGDPLGGLILRGFLRR